MDGMIKDMKSRTILDNCRSEKFFGVDVHRGSVPTPLLLIVKQEALISRNSEQTAHKCCCTNMIR